VINSVVFEAVVVAVGSDFAGEAVFGGVVDGISAVLVLIWEGEDYFYFF